MTDRADELGAKAIFLAAIALAPADREAFVRGACADEALLDRVQRLLAGHAPTESSSPTASEGYGADGQEANSPTTLFPRAIGSFEIVRELGRGGMGVVHLARDSVLDRDVALKTLADWVASDEDAVERFFREARTAAGLSSPHIVQVYQFGEHGQHHFIAMEYVAGRSLAQEMAEQRDKPAPKDRTSFLRIARIAAEVASALDVAHGHAPAVVHRDVKPSNILISQDGSAKLTDFGIAKAITGRDITRGTHVPGTPQYMSPEQATGRDVDQRTDVFSLGVVLYEMLAGRRPFAGETASEIVDSLCNHDAPPLRKLNPAVPMDLAVICHKAIEKQPGDRYQSALQLEAELRSFVRGDPILTRRPGLRRRALRWASKHRRGLLALAAVSSPVILAAALLMARSHWRSSRVLLIVEPEGAGKLVTVSRVDEATFEHGPPQSLGVSPVRRFLPKGSYRIVAYGEGKQLAEVDIRLEPSTMRELRLAPRLLDEDAVTGGMVLVEAGEHRIGREGGAPFEAARSVHLGAFYIDACEVSNAEYKRYVDATGTPMPALWTELGGYDPMLGDRPIVGLRYEEMSAYAAWAGKRLPTALEWDAAARAPDARRYPWAGDAPAMVEPTREDMIAARAGEDSQWLGLYRSRSQAVASAPELRSFLGLYHTFANVSEATSTYVPMYGAMIVKGGTMLDTPATWALDRTELTPPGSMSLSVGFRCARSAFSALSQEARP